MAMSTAAAVVMVVPLAPAFTVVATTAATARQVFHQVVDFFLRCISVHHYIAFKEQRFASKRMIQVYFYFFFSHFQHAAVEAVPLLIL